MEKQKVKNKKLLKHKGKRVYLLVMFFIVIVMSVILYNTHNKEEKYLVNEGVIEYTTNCVAYVIKDETIIDLDNTKVLVPTLSEGSRVSKNNIIATYRGAEYEEYNQKLQEIDNKILQAMKEIDIDYSIEISNLEAQVVSAIVSAKDVSSMVQMQEIRNNINDILSKRAKIIGELSPEEAYVKELIAQREAIEAELKMSSSNVKATIGGIISYNIDGLENKLTEVNTNIANTGITAKTAGAVFCINNGPCDAHELPNILDNV